MNLFDRLRKNFGSWMSTQWEPAPEEPTVPARHSYDQPPPADPHIHINCKWCKWTTGDDNFIPATEFILVNEMCTGWVIAEQTERALFCITLACPVCCRLISRFEKRSVIDKLLAGGMQVVPGIRDAVDDMLKEFEDLTKGTNPPPYDREA